MRLNGVALIYPPLDHWIWLIPAFLIGSCIGSFLNVVIYRVPLGMSVNDPKRSFCPKCKKAIPMWLNLPMVSWLWLRGKWSHGRAPIPQGEWTGPLGLGVRPVNVRRGESSALRV